MESFEDTHLFIAEPLAKVFEELESFFTLQFHLDLRTGGGHVPIHRGRSNVRNTNTAGFNDLVRQRGLGIRGLPIRRRDDVTVGDHIDAGVSLAVVMAPIGPAADLIELLSPWFLASARVNDSMLHCLSFWRKRPSLSCSQIVLRVSRLSPRSENQQ